MTTYKLIQHWRCAECAAVVPQDELLDAPNPFDSQQRITGCPNCHAVESFTDVCDAVGCEADTSAGFPTPDGYRRTCHRHKVG